MSGGAGDDFERVEMLRTRGDTRERTGRFEDAADAWSTALALVEEWLADPLVAQRYTPKEQANLLGIKGGLARRLGAVDVALSSYRRGAAIETAEDLRSTYNRTNALKLALIADARTVAEMHDELIDLRHALERLATDAEATDDAWFWADLGDVRLLLGDDMEAAVAYETFGRRSNSKSPQSTLKVIKEMAEALLAHGDPDAERVVASVAAAEQLLGRWGARPTQGPR